MLEIGKRIMKEIANELECYLLIIANQFSCEITDSLWVFIGQYAPLGYIFFKILCQILVDLNSFFYFE